MSAGLQWHCGVLGPVCTVYATVRRIRDSGESIMTSKTVLASGASIAGPALAYWLHRHGFQATVVEVAPALRPGGHAVDVRGVARDVVEGMGIMPAVRANCV